MTHYEILPVEQRIDSKIETQFDGLIPILNDVYEKNGSFIPEESIMDEPGFANFVSDLTNLLSDNDGDLRADFASQQGICFAIGVARLMQPSSVGLQLNFPQYIKEVRGEDEAQTIIHDTTSFLDDYPSLEGLIEAYLPQIDPSGEYPESAKTITALTFMLMEVSNSNSHIEHTLEALDFDA